MADTVTPSLSSTPSKGLSSFHLLDSIRLPLVTLRGPLVVRCLDQHDKRWLQAKCFVTDDSLYLLINNNNVPQWIRIVLTHVQVQLDTSISSSTLNNTEYFEVASSRKTYTFKAPNHSLAKQWVTNLQSIAETYNDNNLIETPEYLISDLLETRYMNPLIDTLNQWWDTLQKRYHSQGEHRDEFPRQLLTTVEKLSRTTSTDETDTAHSKSIVTNTKEKLENYLGWLLPPSSPPSSTSSSSSITPPLPILRLLRGNIHITLTDTSTLLPPLYPLRNLSYRLYSSANNSRRREKNMNEGKKKAKASSSSSLSPSSSSFSSSAASELLHLLDSNFINTVPLLPILKDYEDNLLQDHRLIWNERRSNMYLTNPATTTTPSSSITTTSSTSSSSSSSSLYNEILWGTVPLTSTTPATDTLSKPSTRLLPTEIPITYPSSSTLHNNIPVILLEAAALAGTDISCILRTYQLKDRRKYASRTSRKQYTSMFINEPVPYLPPPAPPAPSSSSSSSTTTYPSSLPNSFTRNLPASNSNSTTTIANKNSTLSSSSNLTIHITSDPVDRIPTTSLANFLNLSTTTTKNDIYRNDNYSNNDTNKEIDGFVLVTEEDLGSPVSGTPRTVNPSAANGNAGNVAAADKARLRKAWMNLT